MNILKLENFDYLRDIPYEKRKIIVNNLVGLGEFIIELIAYIEPEFNDNNID